MDYTKMRLSLDFVISAVCGSISLAAYANYPETIGIYETNNSFLLGAGILLLLEMAVAALCMSSDRVFEMTDPFRNALFRAHELFAFFLLNFYGANSSSRQTDEYNSLFPAIFILTSSIIVNAMIIGDETTEFIVSENNNLIAPRFLMLVSGLLYAIDLFGNVSLHSIAEDVMFFSIFFFILLIHIFFEMFSDWKFEQKRGFVVISTILVLLSSGGTAAFVLNADGGSTTLEDRLDISACIISIFAVALSHFKGDNN